MITVIIIIISTGATMSKVILILFASSIFVSSAVSAMSVTFLNPGKQGEHFWDMVTDTMRAAANDLNIELEIIYAERNRVNMVKLGQSITARANPPDYLILVNEEQSAQSIYLSTEGTNIKTLMLLNDFLPSQRKAVGFPGTNNLIGAITPDNHSAGRNMMKALHQCSKERSVSTPYHILAIGGDKITPASIDRNLGAISEIKAQKNLKLDRFLYANWNSKEAVKLTTHYLEWAKRNGIRPSAIWAANDPIAFGAKQALEAHNPETVKDVCLVGLNWSALGLKMVKNGDMLLTDGGHFLAGAWSMVMLMDFHHRHSSGSNTVPGNINFQMQPIDRNNVDQYLKHFGDENWDKIDFTRFRLTDQQNYDAYDFSLMNIFRQIE